MTVRWRRPQRFRCAFFPVDNVDTDQIIPARYLTTTTRDGLEDGLFADRRGTGGDRFDLEGARASGARALVAGANFGCGSSREHAVWALQQAGFDAVLARSLADIFRRNALENGLLAIEVSDGLWSALRETGEPVTLDLEQQTVACGARRERFEIEPFARYCMLRRISALDYLLRHDEDITAFESTAGNDPTEGTWTR